MAAQEGRRSRFSRVGPYVSPALAALAFAVFVAVFVWELVSYQRAVVGWANRDLQSRAELAAANLAEPIRTQDFRAIHAFGESCIADGVRLTIEGPSGGRIFDTRQNSGEDGPSYSRKSRSGECTVTIALPAERVLAPFNRALVGFALAGLVGMAGVALFFLVTYRQRVRIRELARLERFRRDFIADVSHEIKTPLTGILGAADLMGPDLPPEMTAKLAGLVRDGARRLNALVQGILSLARLEREEDALNLAETDLAELTRETVETLRPQAEAKGVRLAVRTEALPPRAADAQLLGQAIANLVVNAIRHSGSETVEVTLAAVGGRVRIAVEDHGVGIAPEHRARVFERFYRVDASRDAATGGSGLGLAIVTRIVRLHGGEVRLVAAEPRGARFELWL